MRVLQIWILGQMALQAIALGPKPGTERTSNQLGLTNKYIVEVKKSHTIAYIAKQLSDPFQDISYYQFDCSDIFHGLVIETETHDADGLRIDGVANVWPMKTVPTVSNVEQKPIMGIRPLNYSVHQWTGVDTLHTAGYRGKGATVAIIDTGVDYTHKALGGCFGHGCKISGGYDLVGTIWDAHDERHFPRQPDTDPMDFNGHGTHVAGVLAGDSDWFTGVAPDAKILSYKVFADDPLDTNEAVLIQAFCDAYSAGADIITASIGRPNGFSDDPWALIANRLVSKGIFITIAAGNNGEVGPFYSNGGSTGHGIVAVAAINVTGNPNISTSDPSVAPIPAPFTSWGPTNELLLKPDIGAPGYQVISTLPNQVYGEMSGTSMATPYIAGVAALYISKYGGRELHGPGFAKRLVERIISSGRSVAWAVEGKLRDQRAPPFQVGTGLVNASKVLEFGTHLSFDAFSLLDTETFKSRWTANITNRGNQTVTYTFVVEPQAGVQILEGSYGIKSFFQLEPVRVVPSVVLPTSCVIKSGVTQEVEFIFSLPQEADDLLPIYGGKIWVVGDNAEHLSIPYGGAAYDTEKAFDTMFIGEPVITEWTSNWTWSFNVANDRFDFVELSARLSYPCVQLRWDIFVPFWDESYWAYPPKVGESGYLGSAATMRDADLHHYYDPLRMEKDDTMAFPLTRVPRDYQKFWWFGKFANGSQIAPGNYTMRFAALRPYGNPTISDHWDIMHMPVSNIEIIPYNKTNIAQP